MDMHEMIAKIKEKKELSGLSDSVVRESLETYLKKHRLSLDSLSPSAQKVVMKDIRSELRNLTGRFQKNIKKRAASYGDVQELLATHTSTAEREDFYPQLRKLLSDLEVKSILDLGCGLNPLALATSDYEYYAYDIKEDELEIIQKFFENNKIKGHTKVYDLRKVSEDLPRTDICLVFKVLDILDKNHSIASKIISLVPAPLILVSFSTRKLSGRPMNRPHRIWFETLLKKRGLSFTKIFSSNEIFYLIDKKFGSARDKESGDH
jgi:SAM-dependent methyltransferase